MANEISITTKMVLANGTLKARSEPGVKYVTQTTAGAYQELQSWSTSDTALACGSIATSAYGYCRFTNTDATNYVDIGPESGGAIIPMVRLLAGESSGWMRIKPSVTLRRQANTASCKVLVEMLVA